MSITTVNPATGELIQTFSAFTDAQIEACLARAGDAALSWRATPLDTRIGVLRRAAALLEERQQEYGQLMALEMGKTVSAGAAEAAKCAVTCRFYADHAADFLADEPVAIQGERAWVEFHPIGVVLAVMPWNFPFWQVIRFAAPALCAGNVGLLKHASNVPQCALALEKLFLDAGAPEGVFQTLLIGAGAVAGVLADRRVAAATLTGSEPAGSSVAEIAGKHIKPTVLELGGSDPFIVMPSADVHAAAATAVDARIINSGQSCIAAKRFIVHSEIAESFTRAFCERMASLPVGDPQDPTTKVGPLATKQIRDDIHEQVRQSVDAGARLLLGGSPLERAGWFFQPTVLADPPRHSPAYRDEIFGPVATILTARNVDAAIAIANDVEFGLGASAWTRDPDEAERFARGLAAGNVFINSMVVSDPRFPFGGVKKSGYGRELGGALGMREFMNIKTVRIRGL
jgi:succinate-semialdehyde dehydrogenase/glutarate-semialdehyde dehydrogenase